MGVIGELREERAEERRPGDANVPRHLNALEAAVDEGRMVTSEDLSELVPVRLGPEKLEDFLEQGLSFPRTPILSWLHSCCSSAAADRYLMWKSRDAAVLLLFLDHSMTIVRP
jgi:hypothetical protein